MTVKFSVQPNMVNRDCDIKNVTLVLLPDYYWLILRGECQFIDINPQDNDNGTMVNQYDFDSDIIPFLIRNEENGFTPNGDFLLHIVRDYSNFKKSENIPQSYFTLSHYGLHEPDFDGSRRTNRIRYHLMGAGVLLIAIALWKMYKKRMHAD